VPIQNVVINAVDAQRSVAHLGPGNIDGLAALGADDAGVFVDPDGFPFTAVSSTGPQE
jgi:hypothetical protein